MPAGRYPYWISLRLHSRDVLRLHASRIYDGQETERFGRFRALIYYMLCYVHSRLLASPIMLVLTIELTHSENDKHGC